MRTGGIDPLTRKHLDEAAPEHPVRVGHRGGHTSICNSLAFRLAEVDRKTPDPEGGKFGRDEKGELTGFVAELTKTMGARSSQELLMTVLEAVKADIPQPPPEET